MQVGLKIRRILLLHTLYPQKKVLYNTTKDDKMVS